MDSTAVETQLADDALAKPKKDHIPRWQQVLVRAAGKSVADHTDMTAGTVAEAAMAVACSKDLERLLVVLALVPVAAAVASPDIAALQSTVAAAAVVAEAAEAYRTFAARDTAAPAVPAAPSLVPRTSKHWERHNLGWGLVPVAHLQEGQMDCSPWFNYD